MSRQFQNARTCLYIMFSVSWASCCTNCRWLDFNWSYFLGSFRIVGCGTRSSLLPRTVVFCGLLKNASWTRSTISMLMHSWPLILPVQTHHSFADLLYETVTVCCRQFVIRCRCEASSLCVQLQGAPSLLQLKGRIPLTVNGQLLAGDELKSM